MATLTNDDFRILKKAALRDPDFVSALRADGMDRPTLKATLQAIEDWANLASTRTSAKAAIDTGAGTVTTADFATRLFKLWAGYHAGT